MTKTPTTNDNDNDNATPQDSNSAKTMIRNNSEASSSDPTLTREAAPNPAGNDDETIARPTPPTDSSSSDQTIARPIAGDETRSMIIDQAAVDKAPKEAIDNETTALLPAHNPQASAPTDIRTDETSLLQDNTGNTGGDGTLFQNIPGSKHSPSTLSEPSYSGRTRTYTETRNPLSNTLHKPFSMGGEAIKERFIIKKVLGRGGMGMVCKAVDLRKVEAEDDEPYVAIKLLTGDFQKHPNAFITLQREAKKTQALAHPNIITVYDFDRDEDTVFMTMEELEGHPLDAVLKGKTDVVLNRATAVKIVREIAQALEYAHSKGIIHSDLKPGNIFYTKTGQTKVLDFGIARALNTGLYRDTFDAGDLNALTPKYASLEMFLDETPDPGDDIYALGLIAGELIAGCHPYGNKYAVDVIKAKAQPKFNKELSWLYRRLITKAVALKRQHRTQNATQFLSDLQWAEKGPRRGLIAAAVIVMLVTANALLIDSVDNEIPLSALAETDQQLVLENIAEADTALKFKDYNGAMVYLDRAYQVHPSNDDIEERANQILSLLEANLLQNSTPSNQAFLKEQLLEIGEYGFIALNENYMDLKRQTGL